MRPQRRGRGRLQCNHWFETRLCCTSLFPASFAMFCLPQALICSNAPRSPTRVQLHQLQGYVDSLRSCKMFQLPVKDDKQKTTQRVGSISEEYFELLRTVRQAQWIQECGPSKNSCPENRFRRPLGDLD